MSAFKRLKDESGYSLVEVVISILLLSIAIIPMIGMFDMGLKTATTGSHYDQARVLANSTLDSVRALPYSDAKAAYTPVNATPTAGAPVSCDAGVYDCEVTTTYVDSDFTANALSTTTMRVVVTVTWSGGNSFTTTGLKVQ